LNDAGIPSPRGGVWSDSTVESIVKNETYTGVVKLGKRRNEGAHEALVSKADWRKVQGTRVVSHSGTYKAGLAGGLLECSGCGRPLSVAGHPDRLTYSCRRSSAAGVCPRPVHVSKAAADRFALEVLVDALDGRFGLDLVPSTRELDEAEAALREAKEELGAFERFASARSSNYAAGMDAREASVAEAQRAYDELLSQASGAVDLPRNGCALLHLDDEAQRRVARSLIGSIVVSPGLGRGGPTEERFSTRFVNGREAHGAGR
jgi:hypothetical protein